MKTLYTTTTQMRTAVFAVCSALFLLCCTTATFAQTTFGPFTETPAADLTPVDDLYDGSLGSMIGSSTVVSGVTGTTVIDIEVSVAIQHTWVGDLVIKLVSPDGTVFGLMSSPDEPEPADDGATCCGASTDWLGSTVTFSDFGLIDAETMGTYGSDVCAGDGNCSYFPNPGAIAQPPSAFADLFGETMNGTWTLYVGDMNGGDNGSFDSWSISITTASPSFTLTKTVGLEPDPSGLGCLALPVPTTQSIGVNVGDSVCYWYIAENTGDVELDLFDFVDDQLFPTGLTGIPQTLGIGASIAIPWADLPTEITAEVTNIADITFYDVETGLSAGTETDQATVGIIPPNDECVNAQPLACGVPTTGTTAFATDLGNTTECAMFADDLAVWYSFVGTGYPVKVTTCGSTTDLGTEIAYMAVFTGSCGALVCEPNGSPNSGGDPACGLTNSQSVTLETTLGTTYYVAVMAGIGFPVEIDFDITLDCAPANDLCANAEPIACGQTVTGFTEYGTADNAGTCGTSNTAPGVWYTLVGDGSDVTASLCNNTNYDSKLSVYTGSCGTFTCVTGNDDACGLQSEVNFTATNGTTYYILVHGFGSSVGAFELNVSCVPSGGPANDLCGNAIALDCGDVVSGTTTGASTDAVETGSSCGTSITAPGVWYTVDGTGLDITASLCNNTNYDSKLSIFEGACGSLTCVGGNDDFCGLQSQITWTSTFGTTYYVYVHGFSSATGDFELAIDCETPANDLCADAIPVTCGSVTSGTTVLATIDSDAPTCGTSISSPGVWYSFTGDGTDVTASLCGGASFDTKLSVYTGACGAYVCEVGIDDACGLQSEVTFTSVSGTEYYILVHGFGGANGPFDLSLTCVCPTSASISGGGVACNVGTVDLSIALTGTGPWDIELADGNGGTISVSQTSDNPHIVAVSDAGTYTVTSVTDAFCSSVGDGSSAEVTVAVDPVAGFTWVQTPGTLDVQFTDASTGSPTVYGWDFGDQSGTSSDPNPAYTYAAPGEYEVILDVSNACNQDSYTETITVVPTNDLCDNAVDVACGSTTSGDFLFATADNTGCFSDVGPGVWYHFVGTGDLITVSTCGSNSDTELSIHEGACGSLTCVGGNDDACGLQGLQSEFSFTSTAAQDYYIFVGYWSATLAPTVGDFDLTITCSGPPANDDVCSATPLSLGANGPFSNVGATVEAGEANPGAGTGSSSCESQDGWCDFELGLDNTIWFTFEAPASGNIIIDTDGSDEDTQLAVYSASSCQDLLTGGGVEIAANDDNPDYILTIFSSLVNICGLTPGETYYVQVDGYAGASGDVLVNLTETTVDADFTYAATGLVVDFTDASTASGTIVEWAWDFGDGNTSSDPNPSNTYTLDGPYTVCLTVTDENGCTSEYCEAIQVTDIPTTIAEAVERGMEVYPNPSNGQFVLVVNGVEADVQIIVMDVTGRQVYNEGATLNNSFRKELSLDVAKGTYLLQVATLEGVVTRKIQIH